MFVVSVTTTISELVRENLQNFIWDGSCFSLFTHIRFSILHKRSIHLEFIGIVCQRIEIVRWKFSICMHERDEEKSTEIDKRKMAKRFTFKWIFCNKLKAILYEFQQSHTFNTKKVNNNSNYGQIIHLMRMLYYSIVECVPRINILTYIRASLIFFFKSWWERKSINLNWQCFPSHPISICKFQFDLILIELDKFHLI